LACAPIGEVSILLLSWMNDHEGPGDSAYAGCRLNPENLPKNPTERLDRGNGPALRGAGVHMKPLAELAPAQLPDGDGFDRSP
jgi:hypothetical protein